ncbi:hypothetical protein ACFL3C_02150 [Patescibacteria group bacterium]
MEQKRCTDCGNSFTIDDDELELYEKYDMPPEDICFRCSQMHRLSFRNERVLYQRKCDFSGESILSIYSPDSPYKVYKNTHWYGDKWDALEYGRDFDFNRSFFEQFKELQLEVPRLALINARAENSDYCNMTWGNKNCYLVFGGDFNEDVQCGTLCMYNKDCVDVDLSDKNEVCYFMGDSYNCYGCQYTFDSKNCTDCFFISDCIGCSDCILCTNLVKKSYCILNKQYSKEEYFEKKAELLDGSYSKMKENFKKLLELRNERIVKYFHGVNCENCTGDYINNSKNCINCYNIGDSEDLRNCILVINGKDIFNASYIGHKTEASYGSVATVTANFVNNTYFSFDCNNIDYSEQMQNSENCFGCNGLNHKKNCILNKQYSEDEYKEMRKKIIEHMKKTGEWGKFFPKNLGCFAYNEGTAHQYFPLKKEQALKFGYRWKEEDKREYKPATFTLPDSIKEVPDSVVDEIFACSDCGKNYKINAAELKFYRRFNIPVPHECFECRHRARLNLRTPLHLWDRSCGKCGAEFKTTYSEDRPEQVYCEKCYLEEVV